MYKQIDAPKLAALMIEAWQKREGTNTRTPNIVPRSLPTPNAVWVKIPLRRVR